MKLFCTFLLLYVLSSPADATVYWVAKTGSDGNACSAVDSVNTSTDPGTYKLTINSARACLAGGDDLVIKAGTYAENFNYQQGEHFPSGTQSNPTVIQRFATDTVIIKPAAGDAAGAMWLNARNWITFDGLEFDCVNCTRLAFGVMASTGITLRNSKVYDTRAGSLGTQSCIGEINQSSPNSQFTVENNIVHTCGTQDSTGTGHGIYLSACSNCLVTRNTVFDIANNGIQANNSAVASSVTTTSNTRIEFNHVDHTGTRCMQIANATTTDIYGNICKRNGFISTAFNPINITKGNNVKFYNNVIYASTSTQAAILLTDTATSSTVRNNLVLSNTSNTITDSGGGNTVTNNTSSNDNTLVADAPNGRFSPREGSALIGAGSSSGLPVGYTCVVTCDRGAFQAPNFSNGSVENGDASKIRNNFLTASQSTRNGNGLKGGVFGNWAYLVAAGAVTENSLAITQSTRVDIGVPAVTAGQSVSLTYTRSGTLANNVTDDVCVGGDKGGCYDAEIRSFTASISSFINNVGGGGALATSTLDRYRCMSVYFQTLDGSLAADFSNPSNTPCNASLGQYVTAVFNIAYTVANPDPSELVLRFCDMASCSDQLLTNDGSVNGIAFEQHSQTAFSDGTPLPAPVITNSQPNYATGQIFGQQRTLTVDCVQNCSTQILAYLRVHPTGASLGKQYRIRPYFLDGTPLSAYTQDVLINVGNPVAAKGF